MKRLLVVALTLALIAPAQAAALPTAQLTGPSTGDCIGGTGETINGTANGAYVYPNSPELFFFDLRLTRVDTGAVLQTQHGNTPRTSGYVSSFDTTSLPTNTALRWTLTVTDPSGTATATQTFSSTFDRQAPQKPNVTRVYATAPRSAWIEWGNSTDLGCAGGVTYIPAMTGSQGLFGGGAVDQNAVQNGAAHEAITTPLPYVGGSHLADVYAYDANGVESGPGQGTTVNLPAGTYTTVAGHVRGAGGAGGLSGIIITATRADGTYEHSTLSGADGWYSVRLERATNGPFTITYGPGCSFAPPPYCPPAGKWATSTTTVSQPSEVGTLLARHKTLVAVP